MDIELLDTSDRKKWLELVEGLPEFDIHNHPDYISIFEEHTGDKGYLLQARNDGSSLLFPFFIRKSDDIIDAMSP